MSWVVNLGKFVIIGMELSGMNVVVCAGVVCTNLVDVNLVLLDDSIVLGIILVEKT